MSGGATTSELLEAYVEATESYPWPWVALVGVLVVAAWVLEPRITRGRPLAKLRLGVRLGLTAAAIGVGLWLVIGRASLFDDAFISLRYAQNWLEGRGLVWNEGERVEGYTNFLWTILLALGHVVTRQELPFVALIACVIVWVANIVATERVSAVLGREARGRLPILPVAVGLLAIQDSFVSYGTTGLETGFGALLILLGVLALMRADSPRGAALAGGVFILGALTRPDHGLFYPLAGLVLVIERARPMADARADGLRAIWSAGLDRLVAFSLPFLIYVIYVVWKLDYYGYVMPNTYYAKSGGDTYYSQGLVYATVFLLSSHFFLLIPGFVTGLVLRPAGPKARRFVRFVGLAVPIYVVYVIRVGGDFMHGRFFVVLIPLILLQCELAVSTLVPRCAAPEPEPESGVPLPRSRAACSVAALLGLSMVLSARGTVMLSRPKSQWYLTDETLFYRVENWRPVVVDHPNWVIGNKLGELEAAGIELTIGTTGIGMVGYYSRQEIIDRVGLTDAYVAHLPLDKRGRPGHEKRAPKDYLRERGCQITRSAHMHRKRHERWARIQFGEGAGRRDWAWVYYDNELAAAVEAVDPSIRFTEMPPLLDRYFRRYKKRESFGLAQRKQIRADLTWFDQYYFQHNDDPKRRRAWKSLLSRINVERDQVLRRKSQR